MSEHVVRMSEEEATSDFAEVLAQVRAGVEVVIESDKLAIAVVRPVERRVRLLSESLRLAQVHASTVTLDGDFAHDLEVAVSSHRQPLNLPEWD